jgi:hypothetical protein
MQAGQRRHRPFGRAEHQHGQARQDDEGHRILAIGPRQRSIREKEGRMGIGLGPASSGCQNPA